KGNLPRTASTWPRWLVIIIGEVMSADAHFIEKKLRRWTIDEVVRLLPLASLPDDALVPLFLDHEAMNAVAVSLGGYGYSADQYGKRPATYLNRHPAAVRAFLTGANTNQRALALQTLARIGVNVTPLIDLLVELATGTSK